MAGIDVTPDQIAQARAAGYSDQEIVNHLHASAPDKFDEAAKAGYSPTEVLDHIAPQPSGYWDNAKQGLAEGIEGVGNTLNKAGFTNAGPALSNYGKSIEPENFVPTPIFDKDGNFNGVGAIGKNLARSAPLAAASIGAAGLAPEAAPAAAAVGLGALPGFLASAGNEIDATGSVPRGLATAAGENLVTALPVTRFLGGAGQTAGKVGAAGVASALAKLGITTGEQGVASGAGAATGDLLRTGTVNPTDVANAAVGGAAGGALFAGARKTIPETLNAMKYRDLGNTPEMQQAATQVANRLVANAGGDASDLQGGLVGVGGAQRLGASSLAKTRLAIQSELGDAVSNLKTPLGPDAANVLKSAQQGEHPDANGYDTLAAGLGSDPQAQNVLNLVRQNQALDAVGGSVIHGKLKGGLSSLPSHMLSGEHIAKSGLVGMMALLGEHAGHVIAFSPETIGALGAATAGGRLLDNMTGAQTPAGRFVRNFADGSTPVRVTPTSTAPALPTPGPSAVGPTGPSIAAPPQPWANPPQPAPAPAVRPVAGGSMIPPHVQNYMSALATAAKLKAAQNAPAAAPAPINPNALPSSITAPARAIMRGAATAQKLYDAQDTVQKRDATDLMAARRANAKLEGEGSETSGTPATPAEVEPQVTAPLPQAKGSIIPAGVRALMNARAAAEKLNAPPQPKAVSKGNGKVATTVQTPEGEEYAIPSSAYGHLPPKEAAEKIYADAKAAGKFVGDRDGFIAGTIRNLSTHNAQAQALASQVPGVNAASIAAQFKGVHTQAEAIRHREWLKTQMPQATAALDKVYSDDFIKRTWKKKGQ